VSASEVLSTWTHLWSSSRDSAQWSLVCLRSQWLSNVRTAALVHLFHSVCSYVRAVLIDFTKAFDHTFLMSKLNKLQLPGNIYNWIGSFLSNRHQICRYSGSDSKPASFNGGFVQGSGLGPSFLILALDLNTIAHSNVLIKFSDDSTILVPENCGKRVEAEFKNIQEWANSNSMVINFSC